MEKKTAHYPLAKAHAFIAQGRVRATGTAFEGARALGIDTLDGLCEVVLTLKKGDIRKSMTTHNDHTVWQDVYHATLPAGATVYLKLTVIDDTLIVSFKEK
jgi:motility quorum-sensing regulator/GCU-specific mRNA interferase toxin